MRWAILLLLLCGCAHEREWIRSDLPYPDVSTIPDADPSKSSPIIIYEYDERGYKYWNGRRISD
jgi:hypothetical protein